MPAKRYSVEQIVAKLREAEKHQAQGLTIPQSCKRLGISEQTFYRWRIDKESAGKSGRAAALDAAFSVDQDVGGRWLGKQLAGEFHFTVDGPYRPVYRTKAHSSTLYFAGVRP